MTVASEADVVSENVPEATEETDSDAENDSEIGSTVELEGAARVLVGVASVLEMVADELSSGSSSPSSQARSSSTSLSIGRANEEATKARSRMVM